MVDSYYPILIGIITGELVSNATLLVEHDVDFKPVFEGNRMRAFEAFE